jgi:enoyl-CoA hydratase
MIDFQDRDGVTVAIVRHGQVNALDTELLEELADAFRSFADNRAVVLTGNERAFSAGVDLVRLIDGGRRYAEGFFTALDEAFGAAFACPVPVVAAINGHAIAGGCVLAATADVRIMSAGTIGLPELKVGVPFPTVTLEIMRHLLGAGLGPVVYGAAAYAPDAAAERGLIDEVSTPEDLLARAIERAAELGSGFPSPFAAVKAGLRAPALERIRAVIGEPARMAELWTRDDVLEAAGKVIGR